MLSRRWPGVPGPQFSIALRKPPERYGIRLPWMCDATTLLIKREILDVGDIKQIVFPANVTTDAARRLAPHA
jgi:hypothetical protein